MNGKHQPDSAIFLAPGQQAPSEKNGWMRNPNRKTHRIISVKIMRTVSGTAVRFFKVEPEEETVAGCKVRAGAAKQRKVHRIGTQHSFVHRSDRNKAGRIKGTVGNHLTG